MPKSILSRGCSSCFNTFSPLTNVPWRLSMSSSTQPPFTEIIWACWQLMRLSRSVSSLPACWPMRKGEAFRGTSRRTPLGSITTMRGERGMGLNARRQGRHAPIRLLKQFSTTSYDAEEAESICRRNDLPLPSHPKTGSGGTGVVYKAEDINPRIMSRWSATRKLSEHLALPIGRPVRLQGVEVLRYSRILYRRTSVDRDYSHTAALGRNMAILCVRIG